ncbi:MAG: histidine phosphatase family protein [Myxococcales bacterium]|nr:histidine phosphatase family protein [Myxococcales bacterium]
MADRFLRLVVMRHAKSSWTTEAATDHERPLNDRGRSDAPKIAQRLVELGWCPDRVVSSDSLRTQETWAGMADAMPAPQDVRFTRRLYHAGATAFCQVVSDEPDDAACLLLLGHNPGWEEVVEWLSGQPVRMTTANAVLLRRDRVPWMMALEPETWGLVDVLRPREL